VADLVFAIRNDPAGLSLIDGFDDFGDQRLELSPQRRLQLLR
jgi:hypothetical protein